MIQLYDHVDTDVKNGANLLDRLMKDIVTEADTFEIDSFIPCLQKYINYTKPYIRQMLVSWISVLDAVPQSNLLDYLPEFLSGLFNMLSDTNKDIRQAALNVMTNFLRDIQQADIINFGPIVLILIVHAHSRERETRWVAITWISEFIELGT